MDEDEISIVNRIKKDIDYFNINIREFSNPKIKQIIENDNGMKYVYDMSILYTSDAKSYLDKGDLFTSFSCISYANGLLDALRNINGMVKDV